MNVTRSLPHTSVPDVLDRVLDKGIVIDAWMRVSVVGIELAAVEAQVVVASISTYTKFFPPATDGPAEGAAHLAASSVRAKQRKRRPRRVAARRSRSGARCSLGCTFPSAALRAAPCPYGDGGVCILKPV